MKARLEVQTGARTGLSETFTDDYLSLGRHPTCQLQFDPEADLEVSSRHAAVFVEGALWVLRDLGSTNGTYVNGIKLTGDHVLADRDMIQLGANGPRLLFHLVHDDAPPYVAQRGAPPPTRVSPPPTPRPAPRPDYPSQPPRRTPGPSALPPEARRPGPGTTTRIRVEVAHQTRWFRRTILGLAALLVLAAAGWYWQQRANTAQRAGDLARIDSLIDQLASMAVNVQSLQQNLDSAGRETSRLRGLIDQSGNSPQQVRELRRQLQDAVARQQALANAAALDARGILAANGDAVGLVLVQFADGSSFSASGFGVATDAGGGLVVTNKHVVTGPDGSEPSQLGVVFQGSRQNFRARVVARHPTADLAVIRVSVDRGIPIVKGLQWREPPITAGEPVAMLGFPLGLDVDMGGDWRRVGISASLTAGTVSRVVPTILQLDGYGAQGASGSPIFDREGLVVGVLYGGARESGGRIIYGVPAGAVLELLDMVQ